MSVSSVINEIWYVSFTAPTAGDNICGGASFGFQDGDAMWVDGHDFALAFLDDEGNLPAGFTVVSTYPVGGSFSEDTEDPDVG